MSTKYSYPAQVWALAESIVRAIHKSYYKIGWTDGGGYFIETSHEASVKVIADEIMQQMNQAESTQAHQQEKSSWSQWLDTIRYEHNLEKTTGTKIIDGESK